VERTFWAKGIDQASRVVLMKFNDGRNTQNITAKLVFESPNLQSTFGSAVDAGYPAILAPVSLGSVLVSQVQGPEGYTIEITSGFVDGGASAPEPFFIGLGFGVTDLDASVAFYENGFGMIPTLPYNSADLVEQTMQYPTGGGAGLALQHYNMTTHTYVNNPVKFVSYVPDLGAFVTKITGAGGKVVQAAAPMPAYGGKLGAVLTDPDGYVIELVQE
jgi:predicted enzyme related to lactoylglutathione lyase